MTCPVKLPEPIRPELRGMYCDDDVRPLVERIRELEAERDALRAAAIAAGAPREPTEEMKFAGHCASWRCTDKWYAMWDAWRRTQDAQAGSAKP